MKYEVTNKFLKKMDIYVFFLCSDLKRELERIQKLVGIEKIPKKMLEDFKGRENEQKKLYLDDKEVIFIGYGNKKKNVTNCDVRKLYDIFGHLGKQLNSSEYENKKIWIDVVMNSGNKDILVDNQIISFMLGAYKFDKYIESEGKEKKKNIKIYFFNKNKKMKNKMIKAIREAETQNEIRDLINEPANVLNTETYLKYLKKHKNKKVHMKVLNDNELRKQGLNLILAVNAGSANPAKMIILEYISDSSFRKSKSTCIIGKGVMFDTGGYNIKGGDFTSMKSDMTGSAIVYGVMNLLAENNVKGRFVGIMPLVENMIDGRATRPGDIVVSYSGKTVEITDTDAEGRLILADAMAYSEKYNPKTVIDIATLTGSASVTFGNMSGVIMGYRNGLIFETKSIGEDVHEHMWDMPMWEEYVDLTKSSVADFKNYTQNAHAGAIMAGAFLSNFVPKKNKEIEWLHMDIAGIGFLDNSTHTRHDGGYGGGFRTLYHLLSSK